MAKKARKTIAAKKKKIKTAKAPERITTKVKSKTKPKSKTVAKAKPVRTPREEARPTGIGNKAAGAFQTLVDTIQETDALRKKIERPGSSET